MYVALFSVFFSVLILVSLVLHHSLGDHDATGTLTHPGRPIAAKLTLILAFVGGVSLMAIIAYAHGWEDRGQFVATWAAIEFVAMQLGCECSRRIGFLSTKRMAFHWPFAGVVLALLASVGTFVAFCLRGYGLI